jgi:hypothetical protein
MDQRHVSPALFHQLLHVGLARSVGRGGGRPLFISAAASLVQMTILSGHLKAV